MVSSDCEDSPFNEDSGARYGSQACQEDKCNNRNGYQDIDAGEGLHQAGFLLQQIIYMCREKMNNRQIYAIHYVDDLMTLHFNWAEIDIPIDNLLPQFPGVHYRTAEDRSSLLSYMGCNYVTMYLGKVAEFLLKDIAKTIIEVPITPKNHKRRISEFRAGKAEEIKAQHQVFKVVLQNDGEACVLDISGEQYGYYNPVEKWDEFTAARGERFVHKEEERPLRTDKIQLSHNYEDRPRSFRRILSELWKRLAEPMVDLIKAWMEDKGLDVKTLLRLPTAEFEARVSALLDFLKAQARLDCWLLQEAHEIVEGKK